MHLKDLQKRNHRRAQGWPETIKKIWNLKKKKKEKKWEKKGGQRGGGVVTAQAGVPQLDT